MRRLAAGLALGACLAAPAAAAELAELRGIARSFVRTEKLSVADPAAVSAVVYGNPDYGFFETPAFSTAAGAVTVELVPPGYRKPIDFHLRMKDGGALKPAGRRSYRSPLPPSLSGLRAETVRGRFSFGYLILGGALKDPARPETDSLANFPFIVNRFGEIVWVHRLQPKRRDLRINKFLSSRRLGPGRFAFLASNELTYLEVTDWKGRVESSFDGRFASPPVVLHHDMFERPDGKFLALSRSFHFFPNPTDPGRAREGLSGDTITLLDPATGENSTLWDSVRHYDPAARPDLWVHSDPGRAFSGWDRPSVYDTLHLNSIDPVPGTGYLLSALNLDRLIMLDEKFEKILWDVASDSASFVVRGAPAPMRKQHGANMTPRGTILVFNNGDCASQAASVNSGILELKLDAARGTADAVWSFEPDPPLKACSRSAAYLLPNGRVIAFYMLGDMGPGDRDHDVVLEIDYATRKELGRMRVFHNGPGNSRPTNRAMPIDSIGLERPLGPRPR